MPKPTIRLAGTDYAVTVPFTLAQLEELELLVVAPPAETPQDEIKRGHQQGRDILLAALAPENPGLTAEALAQMRITRKERKEAIETILEISGLTAREDKPAGEAVAGAA